MRPDFVIKIIEKPIYIWPGAKWPSSVPIFAFPNMVTLGMLDAEIAQLFNSDTEDEQFDGFLKEETTE